MPKDPAIESIETSNYVLNTYFVNQKKALEKILKEDLSLKGISDFQEIFQKIEKEDQAKLVLFNFSHTDPDIFLRKPYADAIKTYSLKDSTALTMHTIKGIDEEKKKHYIPYTHVGNGVNGTKSIHFYFDIVNLKPNQSNLNGILRTGNQDVFLEEAALKNGWYYFSSPLFDSWVSTFRNEEEDEHALIPLDVFRAFKKSDSH